MLLMIIVFCAFMFPFVMVIINSLKQKRDIIKSPFSWLFTIKGLSFDNFVKAFNQMNFLNAFKNSLVVTVTATVLVTVLAAMLAYYIVRNVNVFSNIIFALMVASMIIPFQAIMIPLVSVYGGTLNILNHRLDPDLHAHRIFHGDVRVHVPRIHPRKYPAGAGGGRLHRRLYPHPDLLPHRVPAVKADHFHHGNHECDGILE